MKLRRSLLPLARRQKLQSDDLGRAPSAFSYSSSRMGQERGTGRQAKGGPASETAKFGRFWLQRFGLVVLLLAGLASAVNMLSLSTSVKVLPLVSGANRSFLRPANVYEDAASRQLKSSVWNRNKLTVDTAQLSRELLGQFPELNSVSVTVPLLAHRPLIYVQPAEPALVLVSGNGSFIIDTAGKALIAGASPSALNQPGLPLVKDQSGLNIRLNHQALPAASISFIRTIIAQLAAKQITVSSLALPAGTSELDASLAGQAYFIKFNLQSDNPRGQAGTFLATIAQLHRQNITPATYVDVRVDGRAYYK